MRGTTSTASAAPSGASTTLCTPNASGSSLLTTQRLGWTTRITRAHAHGGPSTQQELCLLLAQAIGQLVDAIVEPFGEGAPVPIALTPQLHLVDHVASEPAVAGAELDERKWILRRQSPGVDHAPIDLEGPARHPAPVVRAETLRMGGKVAALADPHAIDVVAKARLVQDVVHVGLEARQEAHELGYVLRRGARPANDFRVGQGSDGTRRRQPIERGQGAFLVDWCHRNARGRELVIPGAPSHGRPQLLDQRGQRLRALVPFPQAEQIPALFELRQVPPRTSWVIGPVVGPSTRSNQKPGHPRGVGATLPRAGELPQERARGSLTRRASPTEILVAQAEPAN